MAAQEKLYDIALGRDNRRELWPLEKIERDKLQIKKFISVVFSMSSKKS